MFSQEYTNAFQRAAQHWGVSPEIHPDDLIFDFVFRHPSFKSKEEAIEYYFSDGANSAQRLRAILTEVCGLANQPLSMLEFASGYGCVTRHLRSVIPYCVPTACDIHPEAIRFIREALGTEAMASARNPDELNLNRTFGVVFALSFFSHMPKKSFSRWLTKLASLVRSGGFLIFTTHGLASAKLFMQYSEFDKDGFLFYPASEQKDLSPRDYGSTAVKPEYVFKCISTIPNFYLKYFHEGWWWGHQDVYVVAAGPEHVELSPDVATTSHAKNSVMTGLILVFGILSRYVWKVRRESHRLLAHVKSFLGLSTI